MGFFGKLTAAALRTVAVPVVAVYDAMTAIPRACGDGEDAFKNTAKQLRKIREDAEGAVEDLEC